MSSFEQLQRLVEDVDLTKLFFTDLNGRLVSLPVNADNLQQLFEDGVGFDGSSIAGISTVDDSDRLLIPVPETFRRLQFRDERVALFLGQIFDHNRERSGADARAVLERVVAQADSEFGFRFLMGPEHEFFLLTAEEYSETLHSDKAGYFIDNPHGKGEAVRSKIIGVLKECGIRFEKAHHEVTPSQHEINLECLEPMAAADRTVLFVHVTQKIADEFGYHATFMPKPFNGFNRNAFHIHCSVQDQAGNNLFCDADAEHRLSKLARQFIGGIIKYARQTSLVMASTFNSYKAYVIEHEAPVVVGWGLKNRSSMVRIPYAAKPQAMRLELRSPDPAGNVYLQFATLIGMGLQGVREQLDCGHPDMGSTYKKNHELKLWDERYLPRSMYEALVEAERSTFLRELLGEQLYTNYFALKAAEWEEYRTHVTVREHERCLRI